VALVERLRPAISRQLTGDVAWNLASFVVMGVAGFALNVPIAALYGAATLGAFNQVYSAYILLSQVAVAGIHLSVLKHAAADPGTANATLIGALVATVAIALPVTLLAYAGSGLIGSLMKSESVAHGIRMALPGVFFFAINKVLLGLHNALARLRPFAVFQALRFVLLVAFLLGLVALSVPGENLPLVFSLAEATLFLVLLVYTARHHPLRLSAESARWVRRHFAFGGRAMWGNLLADVNTRVDILILGVFAPDATVGIYSFAALLAEGFAQLGIVFRNVANPHVARYWVERTRQEFAEKLRKGVVMTYAYTVPLGAVVILLFPLAVRVLGVGQEYMEGWAAFAVLMLGAIASMGYAAFQMVLNQCGFPGYQSLFFALAFGTNLLLNILLIPRLGMLGSAMATAAAFVASVVYLRVLVWKVMRVKM
jgi:O-antigen/teichoic acid export membrane protein